MQDLTPFHMPKFDLSRPMTVGGAASGPAGPCYRVASPWNSACEISVLGCIIGTSAAGLLIPADPAVVPQVGFPPTNLNDGGMDGMLFSGIPNGYYPINSDWFPWPSSGSWLVAGSAFVVVRFRRDASIRHTFPTQVVAPEGKEDQVAKVHAEQTQEYMDSLRNPLRRK